MKRIFLISAIAIIIGLVFSHRPHWLIILWGAQLLLIPWLAGLFMVLVQKENMSYKFLPRLIAGSLMVGFGFTWLLQIIEYTKYYGYYYDRPIWWFLNPIHSGQFSLILAGICIFGGLAGIVVKGIIFLLKTKSESKSILVSRKILGGIFFSFGSAGILFCTVIFLILSFYPASPLLNKVMVDFKLMDVTGVAGYYLLLLSTLIILLMPLVFVVILGLSLFFIKKNFFRPKLFIKLILLFFLSLAVFFPLSFYTKSQFEEKKAAMKENQIEKHFDIKDFDSILVSRFVSFDTIIIKQAEQFSIIARGSEYDRIGLNFEKIDDSTLLIKRSEFETYYNTDTWTMENRDKFFPAGTKYLTIEITMPDVEKISLSGGNMELMDLEVDNIEIALNKRFNNIKGNIAVKDTLKLDAKGGIINLDGSATNLIINSGDCWIEMDEFAVSNAEISASNTSRLNVNVSSDLEIKLDENSVITNHYKE